MKEKKIEESADNNFTSQIEKYEETRRLFYEDPYLHEFQADVIGVIDRKFVILNQTAFYAEGGGQLSDRGYLEKEKLRFNVKEVHYLEGVILHEIEEAKNLKIGDKILGHVDMGRRQSLMRAHTATHLVLGAAWRVLGDHAWQSGAQKGIETSRLDVSHYKRLKREEIEEIERLANMVVREGRRVTCRWFQRDEAEARFGFRLYQGGIVPGKEIRVVEVEGGWDVEACGGTHLTNTSEAGLIKILNTERVQDGIERIIYAVGPYALDEVQRRERSLIEVAEILGSPLDKVVESVSNTVESSREFRKQLDQLQLEASRRTAESLLTNALEVTGIKFVFLSSTYDLNFLIEVGNALEELEGNVVAAMLSSSQGRLAVKAGKGAIELGIHAGKLASEIALKTGGKGGGQPYLGQAGGVDAESFEQALETIIDALKTQLI